MIRDVQEDLKYSHVCVWCIL